MRFFPKKPTIKARPLINVLAATIPDAFSDGVGPKNPQLKLQLDQEKSSAQNLQSITKKVETLFGANQGEKDISLVIFTHGNDDGGKTLIGREAVHPAIIAKAIATHTKQLILIACNIGRGVAKAERKKMTPYEQEIKSGYDELPENLPVILCGGKRTSTESEGMMMLMAIKNTKDTEENQDCFEQNLSLILTTRTFKLVIKKNGKVLEFKSSGPKLEDNCTDIASYKKYIEGQIDKFTQFCTKNDLSPPFSSIAKMEESATKYKSSLTDDNVQFSCLLHLMDKSASSSDSFANLLNEYKNIIAVLPDKLNTMLFGTSLINSIWSKNLLSINAIIDHFGDYLGSIDEEFYKEIYEVICKAGAIEILKRLLEDERIRIDLGEPLRVACNLYRYESDKESKQHLLEIVKLLLNYHLDPKNPKKLDEKDLSSLYLYPQIVSELFKSGKIMDSLFEKSPAIFQYIATTFFNYNNLCDAMHLQSPDKKDIYKKITEAEQSYLSQQFFKIFTKDIIDLFQKADFQTRLEMLAYTWGKKECTGIDQFSLDYENLKNDLCDDSQNIRDFMISVLEMMVEIMQQSDESQQNFCAQYNILFANQDVKSILNLIEEEQKNIKTEETKKAKKDIKKQAQQEKKAKLENVLETIRNHTLIKANIGYQVDKKTFQILFTSKTSSEELIKFANFIKQILFEQPSSFSYKVSQTEIKSTTYQAVIFPFEGLKTEVLEKGSEDLNQWIGQEYEKYLQEIAPKAVDGEGGKPAEASLGNENGLLQPQNHGLESPQGDAPDPSSPKPEEIKTQQKNMPTILHSGLETNIDQKSLVRYYADEITYGELLRIAGVKNIRFDFEPKQLLNLKYSAFVRYLSDHEGKPVAETPTEERHNFIQVLFPNLERGKYGEIYPLLTGEDLKDATPEQKAKIKDNFINALSHMGNHMNIMLAQGVLDNKDGDHNYLRITRIIHYIKILRDAGVQIKNKEIYVYLNHLFSFANNANHKISINQESIGLWQAAIRTLGLRHEYGIFRDQRNQGKKSQTNSPEPEDLAGPKFSEHQEPETGKEVVKVEETTPEIQKIKEIGEVKVFTTGTKEEANNSHFRLVHSITTPYNTKQRDLLRQHLEVETNIDIKFNAYVGDALFDSKRRSYELQTINGAVIINTEETRKYANDVQFFAADGLKKIFGDGTDEKIADFFKHHREQEKAHTYPDSRDHLYHTLATFIIPSKLYAKEDGSIDDEPPLVYLYNYAYPDFSRNRHDYFQGDELDPYVQWTLKQMVALNLKAVAQNAIRLGRKSSFVLHPPADFIRDLNPGQTTAVKKAIIESFKLALKSLSPEERKSVIPIINGGHNYWESGDKSLVAKIIHLAGENKLNFPEHSISFGDLAKRCQKEGIMCSLPLMDNNKCGLGGGYNSDGARSAVEEKLCRMTYGTAVLSGNYAIDNIKNYQIHKIDCGSIDVSEDKLSSTSQERGEYQDLIDQLVNKKGLRLDFNNQKQQFCCAIQNGQNVYFIYANAILEAPIDNPSNISALQDPGIIKEIIKFSGLKEEEIAEEKRLIRDLFGLFESSNQCQNDGEKQYFIFEKNKIYADKILLTDNTEAGAEKVKEIRKKFLTQSENITVIIRKLKLLAVQTNYDDEGKIKFTLGKNHIKYHQEEHLITLDQEDEHPPQDLDQSETIKNIYDLLFKAESKVDDVVKYIYNLVGAEADLPKIGEIQISTYIIRIPFEGIQSIFNASGDSEGEALPISYNQIDQFKKAAENYVKAKNQTTPLKKVTPPEPPRSIEFQNVKKHISDRFNQLNQMLTKAQADDVKEFRVVIPGELEVNRELGEQISRSQQGNYYVGARGHMLGVGIAYISWNSKEEWLALMKVIDDEVNKLFRLFPKNVSCGRIGDYKNGSLRPENERASAKCIHVWGAAKWNWNHEEGAKIVGGGQAEHIDTQRPGVFGMVTMPEKDTDALLDATKFEKHKWFLEAIGKGEAQPPNPPQSEPQPPQPQPQPPQIEPQETSIDFAEETKKITTALGIKFASTGNNQVDYTEAETQIRAKINTRTTTLTTKYEVTEIQQNPTEDAKSDADRLIAHLNKWYYKTTVEKNLTISSKHQESLGSNPDPSPQNPSAFQLQNPFLIVPPSAISGVLSQSARGTNMRVINISNYKQDSDQTTPDINKIKNVLEYIVGNAAKNAGIVPQVLTTISKFAIKNGGFSNKLEVKEGEEGRNKKMAKDNDPLKQFITDSKEKLKLNDDKSINDMVKKIRKFSADIQKEAAELGLFSGRTENLRTDQLVGLRSAFILGIVDMQTMKLTPIDEAKKVEMQQIKAAVKEELQKTPQQK